MVSPGYTRETVSSRVHLMMPPSTYMRLPPGVYRTPPTNGERVPDAVARRVPDTVARKVPDAVARRVPDAVARRVPDTVARGVYLMVPPGVGSRLEPRPTVTTRSRKRSSSTSSREREKGPFTRVCVFRGLLVGSGTGTLGSLAPRPPHPVRRSDRLGVRSASGVSDLVGSPKRKRGYVQYNVQIYVS
jgi:hypothetical protein